jgi:NADH dehydrogenase/NADH:ubiquinone oxidoreductase subunit G
MTAAVLVFILCAAGFSVYGQEKPPDAVADVPALHAFHEVIFKIWHEAWPKKDTAVLRQLLPDVEKGISDVASAKLPGILREKKAAWDEGVKGLQAAGSEYKAAAAGKDDPTLLAAAEKLHSRFEGLMRVTRPALKELDDFHASLYMLYHHYLPDYDIQKIRASAAELKQKMVALNAARLPERFKQKEAEFQSARRKLSESVDALNAVVQSNADQKIKNAVHELHSNYEALAGICD